MRERQDVPYVYMFALKNREGKIQKQNDWLVGISDRGSGSGFGRRRDPVIVEERDGELVTARRGSKGLEGARRDSKEEVCGIRYVCRYVV